MLQNNSGGVVQRARTFQDLYHSYSSTRRRSLPNICSWIRWWCHQPTSLTLDRKCIENSIVWWTRLAGAWFNQMALDGDDSKVWWLLTKFFSYKQKAILFILLELNSTQNSSNPTRDATKYNPRNTISDWFRQNSQHDVISIYDVINHCDVISHRHELGHDAHSRYGEPSVTQQ